MLLYMYHYILKINSRESDFKNVTTNPIQVSFNNTGNSSLIEKIIVKGASVPHVFYNINSKNNILNFTSNTIPYTITFPVGHYNVNSLISYFNSTTQAVAAGVVLSFDSFINKILVTTTNNVVFLHLTSTIFPVLGLRADQDFALSTTTHLTYMSDLSGIRNIYAETSFSNMNCLDAIGFKSYGAFIPVDKPFGSIIHYINQEQDMDSIVRSKVYSQNLNKIQIALRDVDGNILDLQNMNWEITFKIYLSHEHDLVDN